MRPHVQTWKSYSPQFIYIGPQASDLIPLRLSFFISKMGVITTSREFDEAEIIYVKTLSIVPHTYKTLKSVSSRQP